MKVSGEIALTDQTILVTGAAGFIGFHVSNELLKQGVRVVGVDNLNDYYDVTLKEARLARLKGSVGFEFNKLDIANSDDVTELFSNHSFTAVVHLAAQAGVRYSLKNPQAYIDSNLGGFANILEACRNSEVKHLVFASSSSVYGANERMPFSERDRTDWPISLYGATKKANEVMAHSYAYLYGLPCTGLRFFTVYGPWGRPDMAYFKFTKAILERQQIDLYNHGKMKRDFTYVDDVTEGVVRALKKVPQRDHVTSAPCAIYNVGSSKPVALLDFVKSLEKLIGKEAVVRMQDRQVGDMLETYCDGEDFLAATGWKPSTSIDKGLQYFVNWYREYYK